MIESIELPAEIESGWIRQDHLDAFARLIGGKPANVYSLAQVLVERLHDYGLSVYVMTYLHEGRFTKAFKAETQSFLDLDLGALPRIKEIGQKRLDFLETYQAWLRQACTP